MSLRNQIGKWFVPPGFHAMINRIGAERRKDINETVSPVQLRHIYRYQFARKHLFGKKVLDAACGAGYCSDLILSVHLQ